MNAFDRMIGMMLTILLLFIAPIFWMQWRMEAMTELMLQEKVRMLTDEWCLSGEISREAYEETAHYLMHLGEYRILISYQERVKGESGRTFYISVPWEDVQVQLASDSGYFSMHQGDKLSIRVESIGWSAADEMRFRLWGHQVPLYLEYGGIVMAEGGD